MGTQPVAERPVASAVKKAVLTEEQRTAKLRQWKTLRVVRWVLSLALWAYTLASAALFLLPLLHQQELTSLTSLIALLHTVADPSVQAISRVITFNARYQGFNFLYLGVAVASFVVRAMVCSRLMDAEDRVYKPIAAAAEEAARQAALAASKAGKTAREASRTSLLREYAEARKTLGQAKRELAFLSIDVVGSTKMKIDEDKLVIEHAFTEYKKFLERIFRDCDSYKVAWTPDGVMVCFHTADNGCKAARNLLRDLDFFNTLHQMREKFKVRCGLNYGEVLLPDSKPLEEVSDHVIDVAGHLQKYAEHDTLWVSDEAYAKLDDKSGMHSIEQQVDGHSVYVLPKIEAQAAIA